MTVQFEWYAHEVPAVVRKRRLQRHRALLDEKNGVAAILLAQGPPRAWHLGLDAALRGFSEALKQGERKAEPLLAAAASGVRICSRSLVDSSPIQVHGITIYATSTEVSVSTAGSCRAYLHRQTEHRRITPKSDVKGLHNAFTFSTYIEEITSGDIFILGPSHVFGVTGVAQMARLLQERTRITARALARGLLSTADVEQTGGAVIALRVF